MVIFPSILYAYCLHICLSLLPLSNHFFNLSPLAFMTRWNYVIISRGGRKNIVNI